MSKGSTLSNPEGAALSNPKGYTLSNPKGYTLSNPASPSSSLGGETPCRWVAKPPLTGETFCNRFLNIRLHKS